MIKKPFDNLPTITKLLELKKEGVKTADLATYFGCAYSLVVETLRFHTQRVNEIQELTPKKETGKYDHLIFEPINLGKDYKQILKEKGIKIPKEGNFTRMHKYKLNSQPWRLKKKASD